MPVYGSYIIQTQLISVEKGSVSRSSIFTFLVWGLFFLPSEETCRDLHLMLGSPIQGMLAGFPFGSVGYVPKGRGRGEATTRR